MTVKGRKLAIRKHVRMLNKRNQMNSMREEKKERKKATEEE